MSAKVVRDGLTILHTTIKEETLQSPLTMTTFNKGEYYICTCRCGCKALYFLQVESVTEDGIKGVGKDVLVKEYSVVKKLSDEEVIALNFIRKVRGHYPNAEDFVTAP